MPSSCVKHAVLQFFPNICPFSYNSLSKTLFWKELQPVFHSYGCISQCLLLFACPNNSIEESNYVIWEHNQEMRLQGLQNSKHCYFLTHNCRFRSFTKSCLWLIWTPQAACPPYSFCSSSPWDPTLKSQWIIWHYYCHGNSLISCIYRIMIDIPAVSSKSRKERKREEDTASVLMGELSITSTVNTAFFVNLPSPIFHCANIPVQDSHYSPKYTLSAMRSFWYGPWFRQSPVGACTLTHTPQGEHSTQWPRKTSTTEASLTKAPFKHRRYGLK